jgi:hypothetical protein
MNTGSYFPIQFSPSDAPLAYIYQHHDDSPHGPHIGVNLYSSSGLWPYAFEEKKLSFALFEGPYL